MIMMLNNNTRLECSLGAYGYYWEADDGGEIPEGHQDLLVEDADNRVAEMCKEDYTRGELLTTLEKDGVDVSYSGCFYPKLARELKICTKEIESLRETIMELKGNSWKK